jgi:N-acetylglucosaminyldiphosphoundecaprenol N-acetyl-beta-D-mannosaminyltransferase
MNKSKIAHRTVNILGFQLFSKDKESLLEKLKIHLSRKNSPLVIFTPNAEQLVQASSNPNFSRQLKQANLLIPDGVGLIYASKLLSLVKRSAPIKERITGVDLMQELLLLAKTSDRSILLLGGRGYDTLVDDPKQVASCSCWQLQENLYWTEGYDNYSSNPSAEERQLVSKCIATLQPDIVLVALGAPHQEKWVNDNIELCREAQVKIVMSVGGAADMILGKLKRAPVWARKLGLEWLYRLFQEPWRWRRQTRLIKFIWLVLRQVFTGYQLP